MRDHLDQFGDARIAVVTFATRERLAVYRDHLHLPFDVVADTDRTLYELLGAERGSNRQVWSAGTIRMYARLLRAGHRLRRPTEDVRQLGADAVIGRTGELRYLCLPSTPDARPTDRRSNRCARLTTRERYPQMCSRLMHHPLRLDPPMVKGTVPSPVQNACNAAVLHATAPGNAGSALASRRHYGRSSQRRLSVMRDRRPSTT